MEHKLTCSQGGVEEGRGEQEALIANSCGIIMEFTVYQDFETVAYNGITASSVTIS